MIGTNTVAVPTLTLTDRRTILEYGLIAPYDLRDSSRVQIPLVSIVSGTAVASQKRSIVFFDFLGRNFIQILVERIRGITREEATVSKLIVQDIWPALEIQFQGFGKRSMRGVAK